MIKFSRQNKKKEREKKKTHSKSKTISTIIFLLLFFLLNFAPVISLDYGKRVYWRMATWWKFLQTLD